MNDPIVEEVRQIREAHAARFHFDLDALFNDIKEREKASGHNFVSGIARPAKAGQKPSSPGASLSSSSESKPFEVAPAAGH